MRARQKDYIGMWYEARLRQGVDDGIHFALIDPAGGEQREYTIPHRRHDGIGGLLFLLRQWGVSEPMVPRHRQTQPPPWWRWMKGQGEKGATKPLPWRNLDEGAPYGGVRTMCLDRTATALIVGRARTLGVSLNSLLLLALHRAVCQTLLDYPVAGGWMYPVNMRGAVKSPRDDMNLSSGFYVEVSPDLSQISLDWRLRSGLAQNQHWRLWHLAHVGRWVGNSGVDWLYGRMAGKRFYAGSLTNLGRWELNLTEAGFSEKTTLALCGPGSPDHPVSNGIIIVNGRLSLSLRIDRSLLPSQAVVQRCLEAWQGFIYQEL